MKKNFNQTKQDFISGLSKPEFSYAKYFEYLLPYLGSGYNSYEIMTKFHVNNSEQELEEPDLLDFYKYIYDYWYDSISSLSFLEAGKHRKVIKAILKDQRFAKSNMTGSDCEKFFFDTLVNEFKDPALAPVIAQHRKVPYQNGKVEKDFLHVAPLKNLKFSAPLDARLYLNVPPINAAKIGMLLTKLCECSPLPLYFKFWTKANQRNDQFLIYTTFKDAPKMVELLTHIRNLHPELFRGATINSPLYSKVNDFIYFGETPDAEVKSFNGIRAKAFDAYFLKFLSETLSPLVQKDEPIILQDGSKISPKNFFIELMKNHYFEALTKNQLKIEKGQFPNTTLGDTIISSSEAAKQYIDEQNILYKNARKGIFEPDTLVKFEDAADFMVQQIKNGNFPKLLLHVKHYTQTLGISGQSEDEEMTELSNQGHISYFERFGIFDYISTLLSAYHVSDDIQAHINKQSLNEVLNSFGLSPENTSLNQDTAKDLNQVKENERHLC